MESPAHAHTDALRAFDSSCDDPPSPAEVNKILSLIASGPHAAVRFHQSIPTKQIGNVTWVISCAKCDRTLDLQWHLHSEFSRVPRLI